MTTGVGREAARRRRARPRAWETTRLEAPGRPTLEITATPCRHGPPLSHPLVGDVIGFALALRRPEHGVCGSPATPCSTTACARSRTGCDVDVALLHLGGVRSRSPGPLRYTMTARDAVELVRPDPPALAVPIHYEGWKHFKQGRDGIEQALAAAPSETRERFRWVEIGVPTEL